MSKNIKALDNFIKAYDKQKQAQENFEATKSDAIEYLKNNHGKIIYKGRTLTLCEKRSYEYSELVIQMAEATLKQRKVEELTGDAKLKSTSNYIRYCVGNS